MSKTIKVGIVCDNWKLPAFEKSLKAAGLTIKVFPTLTKDVSAIRIKTEDDKLKELELLVKKIEVDVKRSN